VRLILSEIADEALLSDVRQMLETSFQRNVPD
jgi:hypothetical protein